MPRTHLTRKELKEDAVQEAGRSLYEFLSEHYHQILTGALVVVALILLFVAGRGFARRGIERASMELYSFQAEYLRGIALTDEKARAQTLSDVIDSTAAFHAKRGANPVGREALFVKGNCEYMKADYPAALRTFEQYISESPSDEEKARGHLALGDTLANQAFSENQNRELLEKAKAAYDTAEKLGVLPTGKGSYLSYEAMIGRGRVLLMLGEWEEARSLYEKIKEERPFFNEDVEAISSYDIGDWTGLDRVEKTRLIRENALKRKAFASFKEQAQRCLDEMKGRTAAAGIKTAP